MWALSYSKPYLDCYVTMSWCFEDEFDEYAQEILKSRKQSCALVPNSEIVNIARNYKLTSYNAMYLLLAMHEGQAIATKDKALIKACLENGVAIFKSTRLN